MTIEEAIKYAEEVAEENQRVVDTGIVFNDVTIDMLYCDDTEVIEEHLANYQKCAEEHRQLAEWLKDYKRLKDQELCRDAISRQAVLDTLDTSNKFLDEDRTVETYKALLKECYEVLPPVTPKPKMGRWKRISIDKYSEHAKYWYRCDRCGKDNLGDTDFCPSCGCRMIEPQEGEE